VPKSPSLAPNTSEDRCHRKGGTWASGAPPRCCTPATSLALGDGCLLLCPRGMRLLHASGVVVGIPFLQLTK
jgi:hypothetical protein